MFLVSSFPRFPPVNVPGFIIPPVSACFSPQKRKVIISTIASWIARGTPTLSSRLRPVLRQLQSTYYSGLTVAEMRDDLLESFAGVRYIREKLLYLQSQLDIIGKFPYEQDKIELSEHLHRALNEVETK